MPRLTGAGSWVFCVSTFVGVLLLAARNPVVGEVSFVRGDVDASQALDLTDPIQIFGFLFLGDPAELVCEDAGDANDNGTIDISDGIYVLVFLFAGGMQPLPPYPGCGKDPTPDLLECTRFQPCVEPAVEVHVAAEQTFYELAEPVSVVVELSASLESTGTLAVFVFDDSRRPGEDNLTFRDERALTLQARMPRQTSFELTPEQPGLYTLLAQFEADGSGIANDSVRFAIRSEDIPETVPESILSAEIDLVDAGSTLNLLQESSDGGHAVSLHLGSHTHELRVQRTELFAPGAQIPPALEQLATYEGVRITAEGKEEGIVVFAVGSESVFGMITGSEESGGDRVSATRLWVEPLRMYDKQASPRTHLIYEGKDTTLAGFEQHLGPVGGDGGTPSPRAGMANVNAGAGGGSDVEINIDLEVFEHFIDLDRTYHRAVLVGAWLANMKREFVSIQPRESNSHTITVADIKVRLWEVIPLAGYNEHCEHNLSKFAGDHGRRFDALHILFTHLGSDCAGIAGAGGAGVDSTSAVVTDREGINFNLMVLSQEIGHNLDWHRDWRFCEDDEQLAQGCQDSCDDWEPHDPHCDISESWEHPEGWWLFSWSRVRCTVMRGSYDPECDEWFGYSHRDRTVLEHLAEGLWRYFAPVDTTIPGFEFEGVNEFGFAEHVHRQTGIIFVRLPGGFFDMGSPDNECDRDFDEGPAHPVTLNSFLIAKYEVSQKEWQRVMENNPSWFQPGHGGERELPAELLEKERWLDLPVERVSWTDCREFAERTGLSLPTEAQWEYACRAGTVTPFAFGGCVSDQVNHHGLFGYCECPTGDFAGRTMAADPSVHGDPYPANGFGLYQTHGNVWEWCEDEYDSEFYSKPEATQVDPLSFSGSGFRVYRGGDWRSVPRFCRSAYRLFGAPEDRDEPVGFRPAKTLP